MSESIKDHENTKVRIIYNIPVFSLQYSLIGLWESIPPEKTSERSKQLFKELCNSLEYDYEADPEDTIQSECIVRLYQADPSKADQIKQDDKLLAFMNEQVKKKRKAKKADTE